MTDIPVPGGQFLGREGLKSLLQSYDKRPVAQLCQLVFSDLATFQSSEDQYDDMTMLIVGVD